MYFSDLSSVQPSSAERSYPTPQSGFSQLRTVHERYAQELPSLRAIHEEKRRMALGFVPLSIQMHSPSWRHPQPQPHSGGHGVGGVAGRQRTRLLPRYARMARSAPDLGSPLSHHMRVIEASPESRSSSSGFGSKNTSTQQNQSSHSGSTNEWRYLPPYRPPPPAPQQLLQQQQQQQQAQQQTAHHRYQMHHHHYHHHPLAGGTQTAAVAAAATTPPYSMGHWLELITRLNAASENANLHINKAVDVGSVDGHYEFDPSTPTPTASTPTGPRDDVAAAAAMGTFHQVTSLPQRKRVSRYENIESRVQAMKEEFYAYRKRQAMKRAGVELESAC